MRKLLSPNLEAFAKTISIIPTWTWVSLILPTELKKQCTPSDDAAAHVPRNITKSNPLPVLVSKTTKPYETGCRIESLSLQIRESLEMRLEGEAKTTSHGSFEFVSFLQPE